MDLRIISSHLNLDYLQKYGNGDTFIETGTFLGDTVRLAIEAGYKHVHSIELNDDLYSAAVKDFRGNDRVKIWHGDSADCLWDIMQQRTDSDATFWLDAHASGHLAGGKSGGSPIVDELKIIKGFAEHHERLETKLGKTWNGWQDTIFIDDRRLFGSAEWSGVKEEDAIALLKEINPNYKILYLDGHVPGDVICATVK
jgi:hypothetical protein